MEFVDIPSFVQGSDQSIKLSAILLEGTSLFDVGSNQANSGSKNESIPRLLSLITLKYIADHVKKLHRFCFLVVEKQ